MSTDPYASAVVCDVRRQDNITLGALRGEIDLNNSPEFRAALLDTLLDGDPHSLVLDMAQVPYMDSSALAVLVEGMQRLRKRGGKIALTHLQPRVRGLLEIARLDTIFVVAKDEAEALAKLRDVSAAK